MRSTIGTREYSVGSDAGGQARGAYQIHLSRISAGDAVLVSESAVIRLGPAGKPPPRGRNWSDPEWSVARTVLTPKEAKYFFSHPP